MAFDIEGARKAGYTDDEIADHLGQQEGIDTQKARAAGYTSRELLAELSSAWAKKELPAGVTPSNAGGGRGSVNPTDADQITRGVMMAVEGDKPAAPKAPGLESAPRRGTMRAVKPYGAGDARVNAPKVGDSVLDRVDTTAMPDQGLTPQQMEAGSVAPWKQEQDAAIGRYRTGSGVPVAREPDLGNRIGQGVRDFTDNPVARGAAAGFSSLAQPGIGAARAVADVVGATDTADFLGGASRMAGNVEQGSMQGLQGNDKLIADVTNSIANSAPSLAFGMAGGPALRALFVQSAAAEYNQGRNAGFDSGESAARAGIMGAAEALGERFGFPEQIKLLKSVGQHLPTGELAKVFGSMLAKEIPGEQLTTAMQFLADKLGPAALSPNATLADYLNQAGETLKVTIGQTAVMGGGPAALGSTGNTYRRADAAVERSAQTMPERAMADKMGMRPAQLRTETLSRLDDLAAEQGIPSAVVEKLKKASDGKPLAELSGWFKRALGNLGQRGAIRPLDDAALSVLDEQPDSLQQGPQDGKADTPAPGQREAAPQTQEAALADDVAAGLGINTPAPQTLDAGALLAGEDPPPADAPKPATSGDAAPIEGEPINRNWSKFSPDSGTLGIPRADMPQIAASDRGAFVNFINARGVMHQTAELPATDLKPTQAEFSPSKVERFKAGGGRSILVSNDGYVIDGHHQWVSAREQGQPVKAIVLDAPVADVLRLAHQFPSSFTAKGPTRADSGSGNADAGRTEGRGPVDGRTGPGAAPLVSGEQPQPAAAGTAGTAVSIAGAGDAPGATGPARGDTALTAGQAVTLDGQPYTVKSASPKVIRLTGADGKARVISSESANWSKIIPASGAPEASAPATSGESNGQGQEGRRRQEVLTSGAPQRESTTDAAPTPTTKPAEVYAGQFGEGLAEHNAKLKAQEFAKSRPDMAWAVAETEAHSNPKFKPGRYVVEGRPKEADAAQASKAPAPRASGEARAEGVPATGPATAAEAAGLTPSVGGQLAALGRTMRGAGWEIDYIDLDLTGDKPKAEIKIHRGDGRWLWAKVDAQGRASFETFQRESGLGRQKGLKAGARAPLVPQRDDTFLGRQKFEGARAMLRSMVNYLVDNATNPVALADMKAAWAGVMSAHVGDNTLAIQNDVAAEAPTAPKPRGSKLTPHDDPRLTTDEGRQLLEGARPDIGWIQVGGQIIRDPRTAIDPDSPDAHREGDVVGRTPWVGSDLWRNRPEQGGKITEAEAKDAIDKAVAGKPMTTRQKRFVSYVLDSEQDRERQRIEQATNPNIDDFWGMDDLADTGYTGLAEDEQVAADAILAEVDRLGLDRERIIEDASREAEGLTTKEYHVILKRIADEAVAEYRGRIQQADAGPAGEGAGSDGRDAQAPGRPASDGADGPVQAVQAEGLKRGTFEDFIASYENPREAGAARKALGATVTWRDGLKGALSDHLEGAYRSGARVILSASGPAFVTPDMRGWSKADIGSYGMQYANWLSSQPEAAPATDVSEFDLQPQSEAEAIAEAARRDKALADEKAAQDAEQARLKREADAKETKARADQSVDAFQLGQSAEQQFSGQQDIFSEPAPAEPAQQSADTPAEPTETSAAPARPEALIALRKRLSVLQSLRSCIG